MADELGSAGTESSKKDGNDISIAKASLALVAAFGVPAVVAGLSRQSILMHPMAALGSFLLYETIVGIASFISGILTTASNKLGKDWGEAVADKISECTARLVASYRKKYLEHLAYRHRNFDVKGLSTLGPYNLDLNQVFVELTIIPQVPGAISADPVRNAPRLPSGRQALWEYLEPAGVDSQHLVIVGAPGSGKTTLLKHVALALARQPKSLPTSVQKKLPILLFLRDHADKVKENSEFTLVDAIQSSLSKFDGPLAPAGWFEAELSRGRCLIMLDGLDEVADLDTRITVAGWVEKQMVAHGRNPFLITSRPFGYQSNPLAGVNVLEVCPFNINQRERFVQNWYLANEIKKSGKLDPGVKMDARVGADDLLKRVTSTAALSELGVNPLLLTMIATVHCYRSALPRRRVELYAEICDVFLGTFHQARGVSLDFTAPQKQRILQPLAYQMMCLKIRDISVEDAETTILDPLRQASVVTPPADFLKMIENSSGLLLEREQGIYGFAHLTFQEYLAAVYAHEQKLESELSAHVHDSWWHETLRLYCAKASDATPVIEACLVAHENQFTTLALAVECLEEAGSVQPELRERLERLVTENVESPDPAMRRLSSETLLTLRLRQFVRMNNDTYANITLISHAEYQLFLDEKSSEGKYHQPDHWHKPQFPPGEGHTPVVGIRPSDATAFCNWLTRREPGPYQYRPPVLHEPGMAEIVSSSPTITPSSAGFWVTSQSGAVCVCGGHQTPVRPRVTENIFDITRAHHYAHVLDMDIAHNINIARISARDIDLELAHDLDRSIVRHLNIDLTSYNDASDHEHVIALAIQSHGQDNTERTDEGNLYPNQGRDVYRGRYFCEEYDRDLHCAVNSARNISSFIGRDFSSDRTIATGGMPVRYDYRDLARDHYRDQDRARELNRALDRSLSAVIAFREVLGFLWAFKSAKTMDMVAITNFDFGVVGDFDISLITARGLVRDINDNLPACSLDQIDLGNAHMRDIRHSLNIAEHKTRVLMASLENALSRKSISIPAKAAEIASVRVTAYFFFRFLFEVADNDFDDEDVKIARHKLYRSIGLFGLVVDTALSELQSRIENPVFAVEGLRIIREQAESRE